MRLIFVAILCGCLIGLTVGCGGSSSNEVEMPTNPTPPPKNPPVFGSKSVDSNKNADQKRISPPPPRAGKTQPGR